MRTILCSSRPAVVVFAVLVLAVAASAQSTRWIPTWATAVQAVSPQAARAASAPAQPNAAPAPIVSFHNQTVRMVVRSSIGGTQLRVRLSNEHSSTPLKIGAAHIALRAKDASIAAGSDRVLQFSNETSFTIPQLAVAVSNPVNINLPPLTDLTISLYLPDDTGIATIHNTGLHTTYIKDGNLVGRVEMPDSKTSLSWFYLQSVEVLAPADTPVFVAFGDSITDGYASTPNTESSWPSQFAKRLASNPSTARIAVLNEGIGGNRNLQGGLGIAGLARFDRDVLDQPGVKWVSILEGINDIGAGIGEAFVFGPHPNQNPEDVATAEKLIAGYRQYIIRAHYRGVKIIGGTLTSFKDAAYYSDQGEATRKAVNDWIRSSKAFDTVVDFDAVTRNSEVPDVFRPDVDSGDHLHPGDTGYGVMAQAMAAVVRGSASSGKSR